MCQSEQSIQALRPQITFCCGECAAPSFVSGSGPVPVPSGPVEEVMCGVRDGQTVLTKCDDRVF